jgi:hypothetical protein
MQPIDRDRMIVSQRVVVFCLVITMLSLLASAKARESLEMLYIGSLDLLQNEMHNIIPLRSRKTT